MKSQEFNFDNEFSNKVFLGNDKIAGNKPYNPSIIVEGVHTYQLGTVAGNNINYDFGKILKYLEAKGKLLYGYKFKIHQEDHDLLFKLVSYFIQEKENCEKLGIDTDKGILLTGPVGCGKTTLMKLLPYIVPHKPSFTFIPCRNIVFGFNGIGFKLIQDYSDTVSYCFDDLGVEHVGRHYGKDCNVMGEILISRYDVFKNSLPVTSKSRIIKTHITTNLNAEELQQKYGERVRSRMREMFNLVSFDAGSSDKRK